MELYLIIFLFVCQALLIIGLNDESDDLKPKIPECDADGKCDNVESNSQTANKVAFDLSVSSKVVEMFGVANMFQGLEQYFDKEGIIDPKDIFQLEMHEDLDLSGTYKEQKTSFVISPYSKDAHAIIDRIWSMVFYGTVIDMYFPLNVIKEWFETETVFWNGVRTLISFKLDVEYRWLLEQSLQESINQVAAFINEMFQLYLRDIYDLLLTEAANARTSVEFAIPPLLSYTNVTNVLKHVETFVSSCEEGCEAVDVVSKEVSCQGCRYVKIFGRNIYPDPQSFIWRSETWTGEEIRYKAVEGTYKPCPDHQEICIKDESEPKCVGIGRCDTNFYKTLQVTLMAHGNIRLLDIYGVEYSRQLVKDSLISLHGICRSSLEINFFDRGRDMFGINAVLAPALERSKSFEKLEEMILTKKDIEIANLVISKVEGSYKKSYFDLDKPLPKFIENDCFGCDDSEIWCLLQNISLCMSKHQCIDMQYESFKIAESTEIIKFSILMTSDDEYHSIDDVVKNDIIHQIAEQTDSRAVIITYVDLVPLEDEIYFELGLVVMSLHNNTELKNFAIAFHRLTDKALLPIVIPSAVFNAVPGSLLFRQLISGYPKVSQEGSNFSAFGSILTSISLTAAVIATTIILIIACTCGRRRRPDSHTECKGKAIFKEDKIIRSR